MHFIRQLYSGCVRASKAFIFQMHQRLKECEDEEGKEEKKKIQIYITTTSKKFIRSRRSNNAYLVHNILH